MRQALEEIARLEGVVGSFACDPAGRLVACRVPGVYSETMLSAAGREAAALISALERVGGMTVLDLLSGDMRLLVANLGAGSLFILCEPDVDAAYLEANLREAAAGVQELILGGAAGEPPAATTRERLDGIVKEILGERSAKAREILQQAGDDPEALERAAAQIERLTRLFISRRSAAELASRMYEVLTHPTPPVRSG